MNRTALYAVITYFIIGPLAVLVALHTQSDDAFHRQVSLYPESPKFTALVGVDLPNPLYFQGLPLNDITMHLIDGPGEVSESSDGRWFWSYKPTIQDTGKQMEVTVSATGRGMNPPPTTTFKVRVISVVPPRLMGLRRMAAGMSLPQTTTVFSGLDNTLRADQPGLNGAYHLDLIGHDSVLESSDNPLLTYHPPLNRGLGTDTLHISYKPVGMQDYISFGAFPIHVVNPVFNVEVERVNRQAGVYLLRAYLGPREDPIPLDSGLQVVDTSGVYGNYVIAGPPTTAYDSVAREDLELDSMNTTRIGTYDYVLGPQYDSLSGERFVPRPATIDVRDPVTGEMRSIRVESPRGGRSRK